MSRQATFNKMIYLVIYLVRPPAATFPQRGQGLADLIHEEACYP